MNFIRPTLVILFLALVLGLSGCADLRTASSADIRTRVVMKTAQNSSDQFWVAPELQVMHYRLRFSGYDTLYYYLYAVKPLPGAADTRLMLQLDANYGGVVRHYDQAKLPDGGVYQTQQLRHEAVRCQLFSNMVDACLFRDRGSIEFSKAALEAGRINGLTLKMSSATDQDYELIDLPPAYIDGFLQALQTP